MRASFVPPLALLAALLGACEPAPVGEDAGPAVGSKTADVSVNRIDEAAVLAVPDESAPVAFTTDLNFGDQQYRVQAHGNGGPSLLVIRALPAGEPLRRQLDSGVARAWVSDLDANQEGEVLVVTGTGELLAFAFDEGRFAPLDLPALTAEQAAGHEGDDRYEVERNRLVRRFTVDGGGTRKLVYALRQDGLFELESLTGD